MISPALIGALASSSLSLGVPAVVLPPAITLPDVPPPRVGQVLTAQRGTWSNGADSYARQWYRVSGETFTEIPGETGETYEVALDDVGGTIAVGEIATNTAGDSEESFSEETATVEEAL